eukprot:CAMPEP_0168464606 /NCGR_PEP_ID=MMETSP0228-20121227/55666_1 /TAXON_ID=133427 /ORGANISM="Protoceratium reticulatum, Strain CCCM 535 (=CCMP 1889)" /LENGTH=380 /DNA_ID=CAMNT_0008480115 /DNA_START=26 /DNA_END=1165 /DNA_ORIENTATION=+
MGKVVADAGPTACGGTGGLPCGATVVAMMGLTTVAGMAATVVWNACVETITFGVVGAAVGVVGAAVVTATVGAIVGAAVGAAVGAGFGAAVDATGAGVGAAFVVVGGVAVVGVVCTMCAVDVRAVVVVVFTVACWLPFVKTGDMQPTFSCSQHQPFFASDHSTSQNSSPDWQWNWLIWVVVLWLCSRRPPHRPRRVARGRQGRGGVVEDPVLVQPLRGGEGRLRAPRQGRLLHQLGPLAARGRAFATRVVLAQGVEAGSEVLVALLLCVAAEAVATVVAVAALLLQRSHAHGQHLGTRASPAAAGRGLGQLLAVQPWRDAAALLSSRKDVGVAEAGHAALERVLHALGVDVPPRKLGASREVLPPVAPAKEHVAAGALAQ